jgi:predicted transcriptional regulator
MLSVKGGNIKFNSENLIKDLELGEEEMEQEIAKINECLAKMQKTLDTLVKNIIEKQEPSEEPEEPEEEVDTLTIDDVKALLAENNKHLKEEIAKLTGKV